MKKMRLSLWAAMMLAVLCLCGCSRTETKSPDVADSIRTSLDQAGLHNISVAQDRDKGVVTLTGKVTADGDKAKADSIANSMAGGQVVADEIAVLPPGAESDARTVNTDLDFRRGFATTSRMVL
jgi:hyperosmotically inducible periplasmic protein